MNLRQSYDERDVTLSDIFYVRYLTYNMSDSVTVTRRPFDNAQRHVTAFRPVSDAVHSWSYDNIQMIHGSECDIQI